MKIMTSLRYKMKIYKVLIQDGENEYPEYSEFKPEDDFVDGFTREIKEIIEYEATEEEVKVLRKFGVI